MAKPYHILDLIRTFLSINIIERDGYIALDDFILNFICFIWYLLETSLGQVLQVLEQKFIM